MSDSIEKEDIPQVPVSTIVAEPTFTPEVVAALLRNEGGTVEGIPLLARQYVRTYRNIPGAPEIQDLKTTETRAIVGTLSFEPSADIDWAGYTARVQANEDFEQNANNPYFPRWFSKTDKNDACPWVSDTGDINEINQTAINQLFYDWQRPFAPGNKFIDVLKLAPIANSMVMDTIVEALTNFAPMLLRPMGNDTGKNTEFRWSTTLPFLGSLGFDAFRKFSAFVAQHSDEEDFQEWSKVPDAKFAAELQNAVLTSGYPINIGHVDCTDMIQILERCKLVQAPRWLPSLILLHVLKHTRYYLSLNGEKFLFAAYRGRFAFIPIPKNGDHSPLGQGTNKQVLISLQNILRISGGAGKKRTPCELAVAGVLNHIHPDQITRPIPTYKRPDIVIAPAVEMKQAIPNQHERKRLWMDPGISVHNVAKFDSATGEINPLESITNELAMSLEWPCSDAKPDDLKQWIFDLPRKVIPMRPSEIVFSLVRNVNTLGFAMGQRHIYDGILIADFIRRELAGTVIGSLLNKEFPAFWALPMGTTQEETTYLGKTNYCRITAQIIVPGIDATVCSGSTSAPAQRSSASQIERLGTAIYDEFSPPMSPDHFLSPAGFVSLCTGGLVNPGKAMENSPGFHLHHPLFLAAKKGPIVEDMKNRSFLIFMDQLNDGNKCTPDELSAIMTGSASSLARLCTLMWIYKHDIVQRVQELKPEIGNWRFNAHLAIIKMLAGADYPEVEQYLQASMDRCEIQGEHVTGTLAAMGNAVIDLQHYLDTLDDSTLRFWEGQSKSRPIPLFNVLTELIENGSKRNLAKELSSKNEFEQPVLDKLRKRLRRGMSRKVTTRSVKQGDPTTTETYVLKLSPESEDHVIVEKS